MRYIVHKGGWFILLFLVCATAVFGYGAYKGMQATGEQASMDTHGEAYELQEHIEDEFPRDIHPVPVEVYSEHGDNVLTKEVLTALHKTSEDLRSASSSFVNTYLYDVPREITGRPTQTVPGIYTLADAVDRILARQGNSLEDAPEEEVQDAINAVLSHPQMGEFFRSKLSTQYERDGTKWRSEALRFTVYAQNDAFGGGTFRRTVGADAQTRAKERFHRDLQERLSLDTENAELLVLTGDLNLEADEEGFSPAVSARIGGLLIGLAVFAGLMMRSVRVGVVALCGLIVLLIWILGFPWAAQEWVRPSVMTELILPFAFMALGLDFFVYTVNRYDTERCHAPHKRPSQVFPYAFVGISAALLLAMISDAIAFGANYITDVEAVRAFALTGVFGAFAAFMVMGWGAPRVLAWWDDRTPTQFRLPRALRVTSVLTATRTFPKLTITLLVCATFFAGVFIFDIERSLDPKDFLSPNSDFVTSLDVHDKHWGNVRGEEASIYVEGDINNERVQSALDEVMENVADNDAVAHTKEGNTVVMPYGSPDVKTLENDERAWLLTTEVLDTRNLRSVREVKGALKKDLAPIAALADEGLIERYGITGPPFTRLDSLATVTDTLVDTVAAAAIGIFFVLSLAYRSVWYAFITMLPMVLVIVWTYGVMGATGVGLNPITATIAAVSLGIGVDYAVHIVQSFRQKRARGLEIHAALKEVSETTGFAALVAAVSSVAGFAILATAPMPLFATYGMLGMIMIAFSFLAAFLLLPALLALRR